MFKTSLKLILRNWWRNKTCTLISILSLTVGIACTALLISYVSYEYGIEKKNPYLDQLALITTSNIDDQGGRKNMIIASESVNQIKQNYPEVEELLQLGIYWINYIEVNNNKIDAPQIVNASASFPQFFPFEMLYGSWNALEDPGSIIISDEEASRLFGNESALGQEITIHDFYGKAVPVTVGGVVKSRSQSAIKFDALYYHSGKEALHFTLLKVSQGSDLEQLQQKANKDNILPDDKQFHFYSLRQAMDSHQINGGIWHYRKDTLLLTGLISAILVFLIAIFNYVNLSFTRVLQQIKTLHTEKLMGAKASDVHLQIFLDTFLTVLISFALAMLLMHDLLPVFNQIMGIQFSPAYFYSSDFLPLLILFALVFTVIPAWIMSRKISTISGTDYHLFFVTKKNRWVAAMVITQLVIAFALIIASTTANQQVSLFEKSISRYKNIIEVGQVHSQQSVWELQSRLETMPGVENYAFSSGGIVTTFNVVMEIKQPNGESQQSSLMLMSGAVGLAETLKLEQIAGVPWNEVNERYPSSTFVNRSFTNTANISPADIVGTPLHNYVVGYDSTIVVAGVVEDFYFFSFEHKMNPILLQRYDTIEDFDIVYVRAEEGKSKEVFRSLKQAWEETFPDRYFKHSSPYDIFKRTNSKIFEMSHLLRMYSLISILLIGFGLFGITTYAVQQRTKEIGIRKINGAKAHQILWLMMKPMFVWIITGFAIGAPLAWFFMDKWLQQFEYRVSISAGSFLLALLLVTAVTIATVAWQVWRTARKNPVESLRTE